tara:strand:- start:99 stop:968 length:870 start_codon:yes stop_codon:yes gene_type:complete
MKPETFEACIEKGSNKLYLRSSFEVAVRNGAFIKLGKNDIFYKTESSDKINIKRKFSAQENKLTIKGNFNYKLFTGDAASISFDEFEAIKIEKIIDQTGSYKLGEKIYMQGGQVSSFSGNVTGEYAEAEVKKIDDKGRVLELSLTSPGLYISPPKDPIEMMNEEGHTIKVKAEFDYSSQSSILDRDFSFVESDGKETVITLTYPLPKGVTNGELIVNKQVIALNKNYDDESFENEVCQITFDYSPINSIPLLPPNSIDPQTTYNEAVIIIENKFHELDKRLTRMEEMNF